MYPNSNQRFTKRLSRPVGTNRNFNQERRSNFAHNWQNQNPELFAIASFIRRNSEIARHVSLAIIQMLRQEDKIDKEATVYVAFYINRFSIKVDGLATEHLYTEEMFMKAFIASASSIAVYFNKLANDCTVVHRNEPLKESVFETPEVKEEIKNLAISVVEHITDSKVIVTTEKETEKEEKKENKK